MNFVKLNYIISEDVFSLSCESVPKSLMKAFDNGRVK